jgi:putative flavoprotein involved in K+ transport
MDAVGVLDERYDEVDDIVRARNVSSPQLVGTPERINLDLNRLTAAGVHLRGRLAGINDGKAQFSGSLKNKCNLADLKMNRLLGEIDEWVALNNPGGEVDPAHRFDPTRVEESPPLLLDFEKEGIKTVIWATGFAPNYSWLDIPALDRKGKIRHDGGVADVPGMYLLGLTFLRRRKSSFIHGTEDDVEDLSRHLVSYLNSL